MPDADDFSPDGQERLERVLACAADDFRACSTAGELAWLRACARYFEDGAHADEDHGALIDYLGVSSPSVLDRAGYSQTQAQRVMELLPLLEIGADGVCRAPESLPPASPSPVVPAQPELPLAGDSDYAAKPRAPANRHRRSGPSCSFRFASSVSVARPESVRRLRWSPKIDLPAKTIDHLPQIFDLSTSSFDRFVPAAKPRTPTNRGR